MRLFNQYVISGAKIVNFLNTETILRVFYEGDNRIKIFQDIRTLIIKYAFLRSYAVN